MCADDGIPAIEKAYLAALVDALKDIFGDGLRSVLLVGSAAYCQYQPGTSDLDVQAIVADDMATMDALQVVAQRFSHSKMPCPARRLEFVLYTETAANTATPHPRWSLNLNTGSDVPSDVVQTQFNSPSEGTSGSPGSGQHWFLLDIACARELGRTLYGSANTAQAFACPDREWVLDALRDCVMWFAEADSCSPSAVLNACRAWRWAADEVWGSKAQGGDWALSKLDLPNVHRKVVHCALNQRSGTAEDSITGEDSTAFMEMVLANAFRRGLRSDSNVPNDDD